MDKAKLLEKLRGIFLQEMEEHLRTLNSGLLALEKGPPEDDRASLVNTVFRTAHSLKGAARSVDLGGVEQACHAMEEILGQMRQGGPLPSPTVFAVLFSLLDALAAVREAMAAGATPNRRPLDHLTDLLRQAARGEPVQVPAREAAEPPAGGAAPPAVAPVATVRVAVDRVDQLASRGRELLLLQGQLDAALEDVELLTQTLRRWRSDWTALERPLRKMRGALFEARRLPRGAETALYQSGERLRYLDRELERLHGELARTSRHIQQSSRALNDDVAQVRMLPVRDACDGLERAVRDVAAARGRDVRLELDLADVELDRAVLERLRDPLLHLVRNAVDHGVEPPAERAAAGKPRQGVVRVSAQWRGNQVEVVVADDGRGLDLQALKAAAERHGVPIPARPEDVPTLVFQPGLSTVREVSDISGRGVGLDVVKSHVESLHGMVAADTTPGRGTRFVLTVPLTLTSLRGLLVTVGDQRYVLVSHGIRRLLRVPGQVLRQVESHTLLPHEDGHVPVVHLAAAIGEPPLRTQNGLLNLVVLGQQGQQIAFVVDELIAEQEVVIRGLGPRLAGRRNLAGATILGDGKVVFVLNSGELLRWGLTAGPLAVPRPQTQAAVRPRLLVVDDSFTTRALASSVLEAEGYDVSVAVDGVQAWRMFQNQRFDLVVTDVEMPGMDGFSLTDRIRQGSPWGRVPVILLTSRDSADDRARGLEAGADAYLIKSAFDQQTLLETVRQWL